MQKTNPINQKYSINNHHPMKSFFYGLLCLFIMLVSVPAFAQIGIGTKTPAPSAALEVTSSTNNKGILIPRVTATQKNAIASPAEGLLVYQTTAPIGFYYYTGGAWKLMAIQTDLASKVDKVNGKDLSSNDYTTTEKTKLLAITGTNTGDQTTITGNAGTATKLASPRTINGVAFDGTANITVTADAGTLTGTTLKSTVTGSGLTSVGTLANLTVTNPIVGSITGNAATATTASAVTTNANLTGDVTSVGNATTIANNAVTTAKIADVAITNAKIADVAATKITGTLAVANGGTGASTNAAARTNLGLGNVNNTPDLLKPISVETQAALDLKANTETANFTKDITVNGVNIGRGNGNNITNTIIGKQALTSNTTGDSNVAIGYEALSKNIAGGRNNAIGTSALLNNTTGIENTAIGMSALTNNTVGNRNLAIGQQTLFTNTEGVKNVALGYQPLYSNTIGSNNNAIGDWALYQNTTGNDNTGVGSLSGKGISTGSQNTMIGALADVASGAGALTNATALGYGAKVATSNTIQLGNTDVTNIKTSGTITAGAVTYPKVDGVNGQVLSTNGSGTLAWTTPAGLLDQANNSIILNATGSSLNATNSGLFIKPIRIHNSITSAPLEYNNTTGEVTYNSTKTFVINHPTKPANYLVHAAIEGPEAGVYYRGEAKIENNKFVKVSLPDYVSAFANNFTIQITQIYEDTQDENIVLKTSRIKDNSFNVYGKNSSFYWVVYGQRGSVVVEPNKSEVELRGDGPYKYLITK
jgi:hypothetical protein